jgi:hypothetical protein
MVNRLVDLIHQNRHAVIISWSSVRGEGGYSDAMEFDAYGYQYRMGVSNFYVMDGLDKYYKKMEMHWNEVRNKNN